MTTKTTEMVLGADIQPGMVVKLGGRWYRVVRWVDAEWQGTSGYRMAHVVRPYLDARLASRPGYQTFKLIWRDDEHKTREQPAPLWDWVTRELEKEEQL